MTQYHHSVTFENQSTPLVREYSRQPVVIEQIERPHLSSGVRTDKITLSAQARALHEFAAIKDPADGMPAERNTDMNNLNQQQRVGDRAINTYLAVASSR